MTSQSLIVAAHGSHRNPDSATPAHDHAAAIRDRGAFDQVRVAFWKEAPPFRSVLRTVDTAAAYVVPLFVSEGYFVDQVLPREVGLGVADRADTDHAPRVTTTGPVGTHPAMTAVVAERARRVLGDDVAEADAALAVVGHGTERTPDSAEAVYDHVDALRETTAFADVGALFMDETPHVEAVHDRFTAADVAVVPLFVADGFHTRDEIPALLGITDDPRSGYPVPGTVDGRRLWYTSAVGTDPLVPEVILERAAEAGADLDRDAGAAAPVRPDAADAFLSWLDAAPAVDGRRSREWGDLLVVRTDDGYALRHRTDAGRPGDALDVHDPDAVRSLVRTDDDGRYRPFAGERSLPTGWVLPSLDAPDLLRAVATVYPATIETWADDPDPVPFRDVAARQTGIYECVSALAPDDLVALTDAVCGECAHRREWDDGSEAAGHASDPDAGHASDPDAGHPPCREPCSFLVAAAREVLVADHPDASRPDSPDADVPPGDLTDPANRYRVRYRRAGVTDPLIR